MAFTESDYTIVGFRVNKVYKTTWNVTFIEEFERYHSNDNSYLRLVR